MGWSDELAIATAQLKTWVYNYLAQLFLVTLTADSSAIGHADSVESSDEGVDPGAPASEKKGSRPAARYQPWGFQGRPPKGLRGLALRLGSSNLVWLGVAPQQKYGPQNLDVGEAAVFSSGGCQVWLDKNGAIHIDAKSGQDVIVNGGTLKVARDSDPANVGTLAVVAPAGVAGGPCTITFTPSDANGAPGTPSVGTVVTLAGVISNSGGAAHLKG